MSGTPPNTLDIQALFFAHQRELVWHLAKIVKCEETAADLVQESYLILSQTAQQQIIQQPRSFLFRVATNLALNHLRHSKVVEAKMPYLALAGQETPSAEHLVSQGQRLERFLKIVETMPPKSREIFILHKVHGKSLKEVAKQLGITVKAVENHITRGMAYCRNQLLALDEE
jgi:RNA polymerase sigma factor (sigma-70 family)